MKRSFVIILICCTILISAMVVFAQGMKKKRPLPAEYGQVVINNNSAKGQMAPVVFDHWVHRSRFTCRLCHVDIGFGMKANATGIRATDNMSGYYCGSCHNGKMQVDGRRVFTSCSMKPQMELTLSEMSACERCHSLGREVKKSVDFYTVTNNLPRERFGNGVDWERAEKEKKITLIDYLEGISIRRKSLEVRKDFSITPDMKGMPEIIFSHEKHTVWNGCEVCHPEIFTVKKGKNKYTMMDIFDRQYCGVCHGTVAFPMLDCQRCHTQPV